MPVSDALKDDAALLFEAVRAAGELGLSLSTRPNLRCWTKPDGSQVTECDLAVNALLEEQIRQQCPEDGWLSEETPDEPQRLARERLWIIDPIDGTRAFVERGDEWVISIGIVENGASVAGVLYNPVRDELWSAFSGGGAFYNGERLRVSDATELQSATVSASRKAMARAGLAETEFPTDHRFLRSLAHRLARVAKGDVDAALATPGSADWDLAAALLIVQEAGGQVSDFEGGPIRLNGATARHPAFIAAGPGLHGVILKLIGQQRTKIEAEAQE